MTNQQHNYASKPQPPSLSVCEPMPQVLDLSELAAPREVPPAKTGAEFLKLAGEALADLEKDLAAGKSETLVNFLATMGKFPSYSFSNVMLIYLQRPDASHVAGFNTWKKLGRYVIKGEKGIGIIAPMVFGGKQDSNSSRCENEEAPRVRFKVVCVFDVSQTDGKPLAEFAPIQGDPGDYLTRLRDLVTKQNIKLEYDDIPGGAEGLSRGGSITIQKGLSPAEDFSVLVHEYSHERLHKKDRRAETTKTQRETEAEAVAYVVSKTIGLESSTRTSDYIQLYQGDTKTLASSLELIQKTAAEILGELLPKNNQARKEDA